MVEEKQCIFCKIENKKKEVKIIEETKNFIAFPDANPLGEGHTLIVPKKHFVNLMDLPSDLGGELLDIIKKIAEKKLREGFEGFNLLINNFSAAGQVVMHSHFHLIPRKKGDEVKASCG